MTTCATERTSRNVRYTSAYEAEADMTNKTSVDYQGPPRRGRVKLPILTVERRAGWSGLAWQSPGRSPEQRTRLCGSIVWLNQMSLSHLLEFIDAEQRLW